MRMKKVHWHWGSMGVACVCSWKVLEDGKMDWYKVTGYAHVLIKL